MSGVSTPRVHAPRTRPWLRQVSYECISMPEVCWVLVPLNGSVDVGMWVAGMSVKEACKAETSDLVLRYLALC